MKISVPEAAASNSAFEPLNSAARSLPVVDLIDLTMGSNRQTSFQEAWDLQVNTAAPRPHRMQYPFRKRLNDHTAPTHRPASSGSS